MASEEQWNNTGDRPGSANLKPWQPGQSGNPGGRPRGRSITALLREVLEREAEPGKSVAEVIAEMLAAQARLGDLKAIREVLDRTEGKAAPAAPPADDRDDKDFEVDVEPHDKA